MYSGKAFCNVGSGETRGDRVDRDASAAMALLAVSCHQRRSVCFSAVTHSSYLQPLRIAPVGHTGWPMTESGINNNKSESLD